jgi:hypothetical protein
MNELNQNRRFLPKTETEFQNYLNGKKQPRPKFLVHPETRECYRLVEQKDVPVTNWPYEKININRSNIDFYSIGDEKLKEALQNEPTIPQGCHIKSFRLHRKDLESDEHIMTPLQIYALLNAIGVDSAWWPLEDPNCNLDLAKARINVLFRGEKPLGAILWDDSNIKKDGSSTLLMVGLRPEERGHHYGSFLVRWQMTELAKRGVTSINFYTGDTDFIEPQQGSRIPADLYYQKIGAEKKGTMSIDHKTMLGNGYPPYINCFMFDIPKDYFLDPKTLFRQPRFVQEELSRRLDDAFKGNVADIGKN